MPINNYIKWPAERIRQDENNRLVTDIQITAWNGKADSDHTHDYIPLSGTTALAGSLIPAEGKNVMIGAPGYLITNMYTAGLSIYDSSSNQLRTTFTSNGDLVMNGTNTKNSGILHVDTLTAGRRWVLPDKAGTLAVTDDIPTSLPASDVKDWAKADSKPTYTFAEITEKPEKFTPDTHTHTITEVTDLQTTLDGKAAKNHVHDSEKVTNWNNAVVSGAYYAAADATNNPSADAAYSGNVVKGSTIVTQTVVKETIDGDLYKYIRRGQLDTNRTTVTTWGQWQEIQYVVTE